VTPVTFMSLTTWIFLVAGTPADKGLQSDALSNHLQSRPLVQTSATGSVAGGRSGTSGGFGETGKRPVRSVQPQDAVGGINLDPDGL
jgi:hypothetical protein